MEEAMAAAERNASVLMIRLQESEVIYIVTGSWLSLLLSSCNFICYSCMCWRLIEISYCMLQARFARRESRPEDLARIAALEREVWSKNNSRPSFPTIDMYCYARVDDRKG